MTAPERVPRWLERLVLLAYPASFRRRFGGDLVRFLRLQRRETVYRTRVTGPVRFYVDVLLDAARNGVRARIEASRTEGKGMRGQARRWDDREGASERLDRLRGDVRYAVRQLVRQPGFAAVAVLTLMLGIGATTAIFSVVDGILFRPLPYPESDELVAVWLDVTRTGGPVDEWPNYPDIHDLRERSRTLESVGLWAGSLGTLTGRGEPEQLAGAAVSHRMFAEVLQVEPVLGRAFGPEDDTPGAAPTVILSHGLWQRAFGADPDAAGSTVSLNGTAYTILGVMGRDFRPPFIRDAQYWTALRWDMSDNGCGRGSYCIRSIARMAEGATLEESRREATGIGSQLEAEHPQSNVGRTFYLRPLREDLVGPARTGLLVVLAAAGLVLLIACVNVANLLMARGTSRQGELAVRSALGAGRGRILSQLLTESVVLAVVGGALGIALAYVLTDVLVGLAPPDTPRLDEVGVDGRVLAFAAGVSVVAGLLFGALPAVRSAGSDLQDDLRGGGRGGDRSGGGRARSTLVVAQVSLALVLLVGAGLLVRSFQNLRSVDMGFRPAGVLTLRVNVPQSRYPDQESVRAFFPRLEERLAAIPGVRAVGSTTSLPLAGFDSDVDFSVEGRPVPPSGQATTVWYRRITPGYLETMGTPVVRGRGILASDRADAPAVVVVNETFARRFFPDEDAIGQRITFGDPDEDAIWREIVGVAGDVRHFGLRDDSRTALYLPFDQAPTSPLFMVIRTDRDVASLAPEARAAVAELDPLLAAGEVMPLPERVAEALGPERLVATLLGLFAVLALTLAVVGLYGVVSYSVNSRLREMGVRLALGASGGEVGGLVVRKSLALVAMGLVIGVAGALALTRLMGSLLFGVSAADPLTFGGTALVLALVALLAAVLPARRAARVDPVRVLKAE